MHISRNTQLRVLYHAMDFLESHPLLVRTLLRPLVNAPLLSSRLPVLLRAYAGATAFEIHDVDLQQGRIGIGGVEEIMAGSKIIHLLHQTLERAGTAAEKQQALYDMGVELCTWEVSQSLEHGRWAPAVLVPLMVNGRVLDEIQDNPHMARSFTRS